MTNQKTLYFREFLLSESILIGQGGVVNRTTLRAVDWGRAGRVVRLATFPRLPRIFRLAKPPATQNLSASHKKQHNVKNVSMIRHLLLRQRP